MIIIDDQPVVDPKIEALKEEIIALIPDINKTIQFRVFRMKKGWEKEPYDRLKWVRNWFVTAIGLGKIVNDVYARHPKEIWERYKRFGITDLTEQKLLNKRQQELEVFLNKNKPPFIIKGKPDGKQKRYFGKEAESIIAGKPAGDSESELGTHKERIS